MPIPSILQKTRSSDSICNSFSRRKSLQIYYNLVNANSQNLSDNKIFKQKMSDSNCYSPSQGECVPITPHPLYNLLNGIRTHTERILSSFPLPIGIQGVILKLRVRLELTASILQVSHSTIGVIGAFYTRCRQSSINYGHCF